MKGELGVYTKDKQNSLYQKDANSKKFEQEFINKCDWCLAYGKNLITSTNFFKRDMVKNGKKIEINLCSSCKEKLKDIIEIYP